MEKPVPLNIWFRWPHIHVLVKINNCKIFATTAGTKYLRKMEGWVLFTVNGLLNWLFLHYVEVQDINNIILRISEFTILPKYSTTKRGKRI